MADFDRTPVATNEAPGAIGPYSQAIKTGNLVFASGQAGLEPITGNLVEGDVAVQTHRVLDNLIAVLKAAGTDAAHVVKTTVFLIDMADFGAMNTVYATYFPAPFPARSTVAVAALPKGARVEIECVAILA